MYKSTITLSPKYGLNPTNVTCFWCGESKGKVALMGYIENRVRKDLKAPEQTIVDYEPCQSCKEKMKDKYLFVEATTQPNAHNQARIYKDVYPTGKWIGIRKEAAEFIFDELELPKQTVTFLSKPFFKELFDGLKYEDE